MNEADECLAGRVAIVTGGGARGEGIGNGRAAAILLADAGAHVLVVDRDLALAERTVAMVSERGGSAVAAGYDVTDMSQCEAMAADAAERWGRLDILDNNVGIGSAGSVVDESLDRWSNVMHVNVDTMVRASRAAIPYMREVGGGSIVNVSSISALRPRGLTAYSTSKAAVIGLTQAMAVDHGCEGIRVNCVAPGPVFTPMVDRGGMSEEARARRVAASVLATEGTGWDIGHAVRFLSSARAKYITGQVLVVDGGVTLRGPERSN